MGFRCGIVGLPNVGKSTLFNVLTQAMVAAENYPFCTVEPNVGMVPVPDARLERLAALVKPQKVIPAQVRFVDIAGLVKGASHGEGLGNRFLAHVRETQAIVHVVRCFEDDNITHTEGRIDPLADLELIHTELCLADLDSVTRALQRDARRAGAGDKQARHRMEALGKVQAVLDAGSSAGQAELASDERQLLDELQLLTAKPMLIAVNVAEEALAESHWQAVRPWAEAHGAEVLAFSAKAEAELAALSEAERVQYLQLLGLTETGLTRLIRAGYRLLGLHTFFTAGPREVRAWTLPRGASAAAAAAVIHSDFERGFIRAEVTALQDYLAAGGEQQAKQAGTCRLEGRDYVVQDGDVIYFRFQV